MTQGWAGDNSKLVTQNSKLKTHNSEYGVRFLLPRPFGERLDRESDKRVSPARSDLCRRFESETSLVKTGVGNLKSRATEDQPFGQQEIEVEPTRPPPFFARPIPSRDRFELTAPLQQVPRVWRPDGTGPPDSRGGENVSVASQTIETVSKNRPRLALIATETEKHFQQGIHHS
jgi:hypothetical protein